MTGGARAPVKSRSKGEDSRSERAASSASWILRLPSSIGVQWRAPYPINVARREGTERLRVARTSSRRSQSSATVTARSFTVVRRPA